MNKNWFYRVLALALVAMLAVPMFAFAEEDVLATAAEAPAEELATALEGEDEIEPKVTFTADDLIDVLLGVKVTMDGDKIAKIEVLSHNETAGISDSAFNTLPDAIVAANSTEVDTVSGATKTSEALIAAVNDALAQIGK